MSDEQLVAAVEQARVDCHALTATDGWGVAYERELTAERALAAARSEQYADTFELENPWDIGAPCPYLMSDGSEAYLLYVLDEPDPDWDGSSAIVVDPRDDRVAALGIAEFRGVASIRFGAPNDEAIEGHPLHGRGLRAYSAHEVRNSEWLDEHARVNSVHPMHSYAAWRELHHYLLAFHDDMVECIAREVSFRTVRTPFRQTLLELASEILGGGH